MTHLQRVGGELISVDLVGDHPHAGRRGTLEVVNGKVTLTRCQSFLPEMVRVTFDDGESCFSEAKHIREVKPLTRPLRRLGRGM